MAKPGLTKEQARTLKAIERFIDERGHAPSLRQLAVIIRCSLTATHQRVGELADRGHIVKLPNKNRSIAIVRQTCPHCGHEID